MQPLSYQTLPASCWVTSMLNGVLFLKKSNRNVSFRAYSRLHDLLHGYGVRYYKKEELQEYRAVLDDVSRYTRLKMRFCSGAKVEAALRKLHFRNQVAVCDIHGGWHSILLNGREKDWFLGFDPQWTNVRKEQAVPNAYETLPNGNSRVVNVRIYRDHLTRQRMTGKGTFQLGATKWRFLTVLEAA